MIWHRNIKYKELMNPFTATQYRENIIWATIYIVTGTVQNKSTNKKLQLCSKDIHVQIVIMFNDFVDVNKRAIS